ncbi:hypothetical protein CAPTEDRAFT_133663 [Capitella teleta]|uniref:Uncharacterized protein n=1 Tax=Capitella teleta TaxID=283909 RepID=R7UA70_CAPTE|nr:hypothetical protein CAPTEDRAFT_133663 [Capitella teleta]|eukprot:ELU02869.1 hypothetical protein CAPTEDRAFT_133663 [Capitella teleta]
MIPKYSEVCTSLQIQIDLNTLHSWTNSWLLHFHPGKCKVMHIRLTETTPKLSLPNSTSTLDETNIEKDLGIVINNKLTFRQHFTDKINEGNKTLGIIRLSFSNLTPKYLKLLYAAMVRPPLEYCVAVWYPTLKRDKLKVSRKDPLSYPPN